MPGALKLDELQSHYEATQAQSAHDACKRAVWLVLWTSLATPVVSEKKTGDKELTYFTLSMDFLKSDSTAQGSAK